MSAQNRHLVVDGSNIATEGRNLPSLQQLDDAVQSVMNEHQFDSLTVIVDATFAHRIDDSEKAVFEEAVEAGEVIMPPAGVVGRGDAFILQVAEKANATVFSNDSFQEFHGEHDWLFDDERLLGGKPIDVVGWVFVYRTPVRGPASRRSVREAKDGTKGKGKGKSSRRSSKRSSSRNDQPTVSGEKLEPLGAPKSPPPGKVDKKPARGKKASDAAEPAKKSRGRRGRVSDADSGGGRKRSRSSSTADELNDPKTFLAFVSATSIGDTVEGVVETFSSHGCYVRASGAQCYLPSNSMGDPAPKKARDVVSRQQSVTVRVVSLDADRRGINVELIDVGAMVGEDASRQPNQAESDSVGEAPPTRSKSHMATKKAAKKAPAKKAAAKKAPAKKAAAKKAPAKKAAAKKAPAKKAAAKKAPAKKAAAKKAPAKKAAAKKAPAKKAAAKKKR